MTGIFQDIVGFQREIYLAFADHIKAFAAGGGWNAFLLYLPMGILFGATHALAPGHSKAILATYLASSPLGLLRGLAVSLVLSFTHVTMSVLIVLLALPLVSFSSFNNPGRAPLLEDVSRGLLGLIGLWMLYRAFRRRPHVQGAAHGHGEGLAVGFMAGLIPCPLTLFVMTFAVSRGVPEAGIAFALVMMLGVALTLCLVAAATILFRQSMIHLIENRATLLDRASRLIEAVAGILLTLIAVRELFLK
jgi:ABC-type nickel/cobalt efflux system permease component RcnA